jgi:hypothetical protein
VRAPAWTAFCPAHFCIELKKMGRKCGGSGKVFQAPSTAIPMQVFAYKWCNNHAAWAQLPLHCTNICVLNKRPPPPPQSVFVSLCALPTGLDRVYARCTLDYTEFMRAAHWIIQSLCALPYWIMYRVYARCLLDYTAFKRAAHWIIQSLCALPYWIMYRVYARCPLDYTEFMRAALLDYTEFKCAAHRIIQSLCALPHWIIQSLSAVPLISLCSTCQREKV